MVTQTEPLKQLTSIVRNIAVMNGNLHIRGSQVTVDTIISLINADCSIEEILSEHPYLKAADIQEAVNYVSEMRTAITEHLDQLSADNLHLVLEFLAYLTDKENQKETQELINTPGFLESFERGKKDITEGRVTPWEEIKDKRF